VYEGPAAVPEELAVRCSRVVIRPPLGTRPPAPEVVHELELVDVVHVFRLVLVPFLERILPEVRWRTTPARLQLDLDDLESLAWRRLAELHVQRGESDLARRAQAESVRFAALEARALRRFARIYLASPEDADRLRRRLRWRPRRSSAAVHALPNAVRLPPAPPPSRNATTARRTVALFVGTLGHLPNVDALSFFCTEVLPRLRGRTRLDIVGACAPEEVRRLGALPDVRLLGPVPDLAPVYAAADVVVVPLRTGGGTRIKILEAFAHGRPVVSTPHGAEGLAARHGEHLLIAATPAAFAARCRELIEDGALAARLVANARELVTRRYSIDAVSVTVADTL